MLKPLDSKSIFGSKYVGYYSMLVIISFITITSKLSRVPIRPFPSELDA